MSIFEDGYEEPIALLTLRPSTPVFDHAEGSISREKLLHHMLIFFTLYGTGRIDQTSTRFHS
ncbi:MAG TPA: hypothetical protein VM656_17475, partial [Pyrinomonadaceae bacterium]|nr:hypothetical protein [Pyrinomonadaceae bacterium]